MSKRVKNNWAFVHLFMETTSVKQRKSLLNTATKEQINTIAEIVANTLAGVLPISPAARKRLSNGKSVLRTISNRSTATKDRKHLLVKNLSMIANLLGYVKPALKHMKP